MSRRAVALSVGLCLCAGAAWPQTPSSAFTPDQLADAAMAHNREFLALKERVREAEGLRKQARVGLPDGLEVSAIGGQPARKPGEDNFSLAYSHTFETFGKRKKRVEMAGREIAVAQAELEERRRSLVFATKMRFADVAVERQKLAAIDRLAQLNREYLQLTETRVQKGDAAPLEAGLLRVEFNRDQAQRMLTQGRAQSALLELRQALDLGTSQALDIVSSLEAPPFAEDLVQLKAAALQKRPDLILLRQEELQAGRQTELARVETKPNITLSGQYTHSDSAFDQYGLTSAGALTPIRDHDDMLGIGFSVPMTTSRRNQGNIQASAARQAAVRLRREYLESNIPQQVEAAFGHWQAAKQAATVFSSGVVQQSENNLSVMRQAYNLGELRLIDILNEQRRLLDTELTYIGTQGDLFRAYVELEQAIGGSLP